MCVCGGGGGPSLGWAGHVSCVGLTWAWHVTLPCPAPPFLPVLQLQLQPTLRNQQQQQPSSAPPHLDPATSFPSQPPASQAAQGGAPPPTNRLAELFANARKDPHVQGQRQGGLAAMLQVGRGGGGTWGGTTPAPLLDILESPHVHAHTPPCTHTHMHCHGYAREEYVEGSRWL